MLKFYMCVSAVSYLIGPEWKTIILHFNPYEPSVFLSWFCFLQSMSQLHPNQMQRYDHNQTEVLVIRTQIALLVPKNHR